MEPLELRVAARLDLLRSFRLRPFLVTGGGWYDLQMEGPAWGYAYDSTGVHRAAGWGTTHWANFDLSAGSGLFLHSTVFVKLMFNLDG